MFPVWNGMLFRGNFVQEWTRGVTNTRPDQDTSGSNGCAKPGSRYLTWLSIKFLISRSTVYSIISVPFSLWALSHCDEPVIKVATWSVAWLQIGIFFQTKLKILRSLASPDFSLHTRPDTNFLCSFHPYSGYDYLKYIAVCHLHLPQMKCLCRWWLLKIRSWLGASHCSFLRGRWSMYPYGHRTKNHSMIASL